MLYHSCTGAFQLDNVGKKEKNREKLYSKNLTLYFNKNIIETCLRKIRSISNFVRVRLIILDIIETM